MKKILLSFVALFAMVSMATAQRAWAYDLELTPSVDSYTFAFKAVTAGDATLVFYKEGVEAGTLNLGSVSAGANTVTKTSEELLEAIQQSGDFTWGVKMTGSAIGLNSKGFTLEVTDVDRGIYNFYLPQGVAVDNNPESSTFGKIYIAEATDGATDGGSDRADNQKRGIFVYDQTLAELNPTSNVGIIPSNVTLVDASRQAMHRIAVNPVNGHVAFAYNIAGSTAVWSVDPNDLAGAATDLIAGLGITKANSICFDENGVLYVMDNGNTSTGGTLVKVENGTLTKIVQNAIWGVEDNSIVSDGRGGIWIAQNRSGIDAYAVLSHVNAAGAIDFKVTNASATALKDLFPTANGNASYRGQCAYNTREDLLAFGGNYRSSVYKVTYDAETGIPSLALSYRTPYLSKNIDGLAFDYAGDLYLLSASAERFYKYSAPTNNNTCTVPAKKSQVITLVSATPEYNVTISVNGNGNVTGANTGTYLEGTELTLTATPAEHYEFTGWTGDVTSTDNPLTITVDGNKTITANFAKKQYTLTVLTNDENKGTVSGAGTYDYGTVVTIAAIAQPGYKLLYWSDDRSKELSRTITMNKNEALSAYFVKEYAVEPTFTIEKVWENAQVPAATGDGYQAVGWDQKIYMQNKTAGKIQVFSNGTDAIVDYATSGTGQQIAVDEAGNLIVFNASFATSTPNSILIYKKGDATGTVVPFTLQDPARCDFFSASGDIYSPEGGYVYFYCAGKTVINRLKIANGAATASDITTDVVGGGIYQTGSNQNHVIVDIFGNLVTHARSNSVDWINVYTNECAKFTLPSIKLGTLGGCSFELGGKELWAYHAGATNYSSEWNLYNMTDGKFLSDTILYAVDKTSSSNNACNWLNVQVVDEKTAYIYQFCPKKAVALWKVSLKENYTVSASATNGTVTGAGNYQEGATATLTATPNTGYKFVNWTKGGEVVSTDATYSFPVTENVELVANFEALAQYKINAHADHTSKGYVTGGGDYYEGEEVVLKATAKSGYYFTQWNDGNTDNPRIITVSGEAEYIAVFAEAHPRAWAYDMKLGEDGDNYTFTFKATAAGQATITFKDKDGNALAQPASQTIAAVVGENKFTIAKNAFAAGVDAFWSITMDGDPIPAIAEVTDQTRGIYDFYNMMGVVVDNNTDSKDFGKIYVQMSLEGTTQGKAQTPGLFMFDQKLDGLNSDPNVGIQPSLPAEYTIGGDRNKFHRLNINPNTGDLVYSYNIANQPAVFAINREDMTTTNLITGVVGFTRTAAHCFDTEGTLYVMDIANNQGRIYRVKDGVATPMTEATGKLVNASIAMESDGNGGLWVSHNRGQMDTYYQLAHIASNGDIDWYIDSSNPQGFEGSSARGALAYDVERQILAQGRNGKVELYTVSYEPTITLTPLHTIASNDLGTNIDGLAFDYAGDLYVVNSSKEKFQKFTLPTADNICTVAAPALEAVRFTPVYTVSVASNNNEWGIANGGGTFEEGQSATITAVAATNYKFVNWTKDGAEVSTENPYTFVVTESATYVANFVEKTKYTINVTYDNIMGTVTGDGSYYEGTEVTLTATAKGGYVFVDWSDGNTDETRIIEVTSALNLTANFKVAVPRAWAYDLRLDADTDPANYIFTFKTTSAGTATLIFKDEDGNIQNFGTHTATANVAEEKTITIAKTVFDAATKDIYWEVELAGEAIAKMAELTEPTKGIYNFYVPQGVAVDNSPNSMYFGRIYVAEGTTGGNDGLTEMAKQMTAGLFVYNQALEKVQPATGYTGIIPQNVTFDTNKPTSADEINIIRQQMHRVAIDPVTGEVVFAYYKDGATAVYGMNPDNLAGNARNYLVDNQITYAQSLCFDEDGALYVMNNANAGQTGGQIYKVQNGEVALFAAHDKNNQWAVYDNALAADGRGGLWIAQNRYGYDYPILSHVNKNGEVDFAVKENLNGWFPNNNTGSSYRGQLAYNLNENILAFAGNKMVTLFTVAYDGNGKPTLNKLMSTPLLGGGNIDGVAFDYAGDLYVASASAERLYKFVVPTTDNICTVPAPESQIIMKEARYTVTVVADLAEMGTVTEGGEYKAGEKVTLTATANTDYRFINWTIGSDVISTDASFEYTVPAENVTITAHFELKPLAMVGVVKRAVQIGESTVVLTHEANGTPHLYKVVDGELEAEISQEGVEAVDAGYLSISDIAATEDGKLVACNYNKCKFGDDPNGPKVTFYKWKTLTSDPVVWFTSVKSANYTEAYMGNSMAVKGTSDDAVVTITGITTAATCNTRYSHHKIVGGVYDESQNYSRSNNIDALNAKMLDGDCKYYELNASPLADKNWIVDGRNTAPIEFVGTYDATAVTTYTEMDDASILGKKFNGATYFTIEGTHFMVAPYADASGNVAGVKVLDITNGFATAQELETRNITTPQAATAAATAVEVDGTNLLITLVADATIYTFDVALESSVTIDENADNTTALENYDGEVVTATVTRSFGPNKYLTLTLPFDMNPTQIRNVFGNATVYALYNVVEYNAEEVHLQFSPESTITAGKPYILKTAASGYDAEDGFTMEGVAIDLSLKPVTSGAVTMVPVLDAGGTLDQSDEYFLSNNALYCAGTYPRTILGLRAYFESTSPLPIRARVVFQDNAATSIPMVETQPANQVRKVLKDGQLIIIRGEEMYNMQGQRME